MYHRRSQDGKGGSTTKGGHRLGKNFGSWIAISVNDCVLANYLASYLRF